jgi:hypothetical protein
MHQVEDHDAYVTAGLTVIELGEIRAANKDKPLSAPRVINEP